jgi:hypothetical protein
MHRIIERKKTDMRAFAQKPKTTQQTTSAKSTIPSRAHFGQSNEVNSIFRLQRTIGNQAVLRRLQTHAEEPDARLTGASSPRFSHDFSQISVHATSPGHIQAKLTVSAPGDSYEQEADRISEQMMGMPEPQLQSACVCGGGCPECCAEQPDQVPERLQTKRAQASDMGQIAAPPIVHEVLRSPGQPLDPATRIFMEPRFGCDFSHVRVHTDARAAESARVVNAQAYTVGRDVVFGAGQYAPLTPIEKSLLAHELTHVVQQSGLDSRNEVLTIGKANDAHEQEASQAANWLMYQRLDTPRTMPDVQRVFNPIIMRSQLFTSTMEICRRLLESRVFHVSQGSIRVTANAVYERRGTPECSSAGYHMTLNQKGLIFGSEYGTCEFPQGQPFSRQWTNLPDGDYYLTIWTNNTNPYCCLVGNIVVEQQSGLSGDSCTQPPPGPLETLHTALDLAGLIPALGAVPDAINVGIYLIEGNWTNAGLSAVAIIPIFGEAATVGKIGTRTVVRVTGEDIERVGRNRIAAGLREVRASRRAVTETAEEVTEEGLRRRIFAQRNPPIADPTLPPGTGHTDRFGNITYSSAGSATDQALVLYHEQVHSFLSPRLNVLRNFRADLGMAAYQRSAFLRYLEEALAETYAQLRVYGIRNLPNGLRFPIQNGYVTLRAVVTEAAIGTVLFGGLTYGVYIWASQESEAVTP